jgi:pyruvate dehydrogenase E1 component alpha subunit
MTAISKEDLIQFEAEIADLFKAKQIRTIIHLYSGGEEDMIRIFKGIRPQDWVMCSWRSHYQCLLKGVPREELKAEIIAGRSIALCFPEYRIMSSGIVGGILPIAMGVALAIKRSGEDSKVHVFVGDMSAETGIAHECIKYAYGHDLPIRFHVEDNGLSVCTDTKKVWGITSEIPTVVGHPKVDYFDYIPGRFPHAGAGKRVEF